jgi:uncharacterized SAM-binding protein YcdF (DUF218 family)
MRRSIQEFQTVGVQVTPVPAQFVTGGGLAYIWVDYLPSARDLLRSASALRENVGMLFSSVMRKPVFR